jgi:hypothetical protein
MKPPRKWSKIDRRTIAVDSLTPSEAEEVRESVMTVWTSWQKKKATLAKDEVKNLEGSRAFGVLKRQHQYWADQDRQDRRKPYDAKRHARIKADDWSPEDPDRVKANLKVRWDRACSSVISILMGYPALEPIPPAWSSSQPRDPRWITSEDNADLREKLAPHIAALVAVAEHDTLYGRSLRFGPPGRGQLEGPELYEWDFLQTRLFRGLREDADFRRHQSHGEKFGFDEGDDLEDDFGATPGVGEPARYDSDPTEPQDFSESGPDEYNPEPLVPMRTSKRRYKQEAEPACGYSPEAAACRARLEAMADASDRNQGEVEIARQAVQRRERKERETCLAALQVEDAQRRALREFVQAALQAPERPSQ